VAAKVVGRLAVTAMLLEFWNRMVGGDDEDGIPYYDKNVPEWVRDRNFVIMLPGTDGHAITFPLPYGYNFFHALGRNAIAALPEELGGQKGKSAGRAALDVVSVGLDTFNPVGGEASILQTVTPTLIDPWVQIATNETFWGGPISKTPSPYGPEKPKHTQAFSTVNPALHEFTVWLNKLGGGDEVTPAPFSPFDRNPEALEHLVEFTGGSAGRSLKKILVDIPSALFSSKPLEWNDVPVVRRFVTGPTEWYDTTLFWENINEVQRARERVNLYRRRGDMGRARAAASDPLYRLSGSSGKFRSTVQDLNRAGREEEARAVMRKWNRLVREAE
jgi:hypothetical protein